MESPREQEIIADFLDAAGVAVLKKELQATKAALVLWQSRAREAANYLQKTVAGGTDFWTVWNGLDHVALCDCGWAEWRPRHAEYGPAEAGWCIVSGADSDGVHYYGNVSFCPICGSKLPDKPPGTP